VHLRSILGNMGVIVLPDQIALARAHEAFRPDGSLTEATQQAGIEALGKTLASLLMKLRA
jgi:chromate reductase